MNLQKNDAVTHPQAVSISAAVDELLRDASGNSWFLNSYWPENRIRALTMLADAFKYTSRRPVRVFEPGCGTGYISVLAARIGCRVIAADAWNLPERNANFERIGVEYFDANFNAPAPFRHLPDECFDAILFGEVFEHLLFHPAGMLRDLYRVLTPGGVLLLTTPNPSTITNAFRVLLGKHSLWGTSEFIETPKFYFEEPSQIRVIDMGEIHYREYLRHELVGALTASGFEIVKASYIGIGGSPVQSIVKRAVKTLLGPIARHHRLFASSHYIIGRRPDTKGNGMEEKQLRTSE